MKPLKRTALRWLAGLETAQLWSTVVSRTRRMNSLKQRLQTGRE